VLISDADKVSGQNKKAIREDGFQKQG